MNVTEAIANFLKYQHEQNPNIPSHLYLPGRSEVQVNVSPDGGTPVGDIYADNKGGQRWTNGIYEWGAFRLPANAWHDPRPLEFSLEWPLSVHCEGLGLTGWTWDAETGG